MSSAPANTKRVTILDVARATGYSRAIVGAVLGNYSYCTASEKTRALIRDKAQEMGFRPNLLARSLKTGDSRIIGMVLTVYTYISSVDRLRNVIRALAVKGYDPYITYVESSTPGAQLEALKKLADRGCSAALLLNNDPQFTAEDVSSLGSMQVFSFCRSSQTGFIGKNTIFTDFSAGLKEGWQRLEELGHRHIAFISGGSLKPDDPRLLFARRYYEDRGLIHTSYPILHCDGSNQRFLESGTLNDFLLSHPECTALQCSNDEVALRVINLLQEMGYKVPEDYSVVGFDNSRIVRFVTPEIASVEYETAAMASDMVDLIICRISGKDHSIEHVRPSKFIERASIGKAPER